MIQGGKTEDCSTVHGPEELVGDDDSRELMQSCPPFVLSQTDIAPFHCRM